MANDVAGRIHRRRRTPKSRSLPKARGWILLAAALCLATGAVLLLEAKPTETLDNVAWVVGVADFDQTSCWVFPRVPVHRHARALFACLDGVEAKFFLAFASRREAAPIGTRPAVSSSSFDRRRDETYRSQKGWYYQFRAGYPRLGAEVGESMIAAARTAPDDSRRLWVEAGVIAALGASDTDGCAPLLLARAATPDRGLEIDCAAPSLELDEALASLRDLWALLGEEVRKLESWSASGRFIAENRFYPENGAQGIPILEQAAFEDRLRAGQSQVTIENRSSVPPDEIYRRLRIALVHRNSPRIEALRDAYFVQSAEIYLLAPSQPGGEAL